MKFVFIPGDGVGREIAAELRKICQALENYTNIKFHIQTIDLGMEHYQRSGTIVPDGVIAECEKAAAVWVGPISEKATDGTIIQNEILGHITSGLGMEFYNRDISPFNPNAGQLSDAPYKIRILQDNVNFGNGDEIISSQISSDEKIYLDFSVTTRSSVRRLISHALELIEKKEHHKIILALPESQINRQSSWGEEYKRFTADGDIPLSIVSIDRLIFGLLHRPEDIDLVITLSPFGAILSKIGAALEGGLGLGFESYFNSEGKRLYHVLHPPSSKFRGKNAANPIGAVRSLADILHRLNRVPLGKTLDEAIRLSLQAGWTTRDMGGSMGTSEIGDFICNKISDLNP